MNSFVSFLLSIRWQDIIDVLFNGYILFRLYVLFRGSNVLRVIAGIALLWILQRIAVSIGLIVTSWAMQGIIAGAALIIVIVFRNEIRNVLQAKNLRTLLWEFPRKTARTPTQSIIEAVYELARNRIGALIVLPGKENIEESLQGGVEWQGLISRQMLETVFWNGNPVHDGAAIIEGDRVTRVGAVLPLTTREDLPHYYGTRHRAAAGLAEQTDALVIVVSEERGKVVAAKGNDIIPVHDNLTLEKVLSEHLGTSDKSSETLRRERFELGLAAVICVLCMGGVWFSFARGIETLTSLEIPLEYMNRDPQMIILSTSVNTVRLHLAGSGALINSLRSDQVKVKVDLAKAKSGENTFNITSENIARPPGVRINRIEPPNVMVALDIPMHKELPVQVDWVGSLEEGLLLQNVVITPPTVTIVGPEGATSKSSTIYTEKVNLNTLPKSGQITVPISLDPPGFKLADGQPTKVEVRYSLKKKEPIAP